jgi:EAL domain-containing protein (putative c-di-GMP-specific phosphodiesterase class I)
MNIMTNTNPHTAFVAERALYETIERLGKAPQGRITVHIHLSKLQAHRRRDQYIRIAVDTFESQVQAFGGQVFRLNNSDLVFVGYSSDLLALEAAVNRLRLLFNEDPLTQMAAESEPGVFSTWYMLEKNYDKFLSVARGIYRAAEQSRTLLLQEHELKDGNGALKPLQPDMLSKLEAAIAKADLSNMIRNQMVCSAMEGQPIQAVYREFFVAIGALQESITPGIDLRANRWLFQYLTSKLDQRMLSHITHENMVRGDTAFSLNLNVNTVLSPQFQKFDRTVSSRTRGRLVVEMQLVDIFSDLGAFLFARDYLQEHGYRICIDGVTHLTLRYIDRARLGADLVKLYWTPEGVNTIEPSMLPMFKEMVMQTGQARTILCRCEDEFALEFGRAAGIMMFQGQYIERLYNRQRDRMTVADIAAEPEMQIIPELRATR